MTTFDSGGQDETLGGVTNEQRADEAHMHQAWESSATAEPENQGQPPLQTASEKNPGTSVALSLSSSTQQAVTSNPDFIAPDHMPPLKSKCIFVYRNGDNHFPAKRVIINRKELRTWRSFLDVLTDSVSTSKGAVRRLQTPRYGHIVRDFDELQHNAQYVAVGREKYKTLDYLDIKEPEHFNPTVVPLRQLLGEKLAPYSGPAVASRYSSLKIGKVIKVYPNGDRFSKPSIVALRPMELLAMRYVVRVLAERMQLLNGVAVRRLYSMHGELVRHAADLQNNGLYVACGFEKFVPCEYGNEPPPLFVSPRRPNPVKYLAAPPTREQSQLDDFSPTHRTPVLANESQRSARQTLQKYPHALPPIGGQRDAAEGDVDPFHAQPKETSYVPSVADSRVTRVARVTEPAPHIPPPAFETREPLPAIAPSVHQLPPVEESFEARESARVYPYAPEEYERAPEFGELSAEETGQREQSELHAELLEGQQFNDADVDPQQIAPGAETHEGGESQQQQAFLTDTEPPSNAAVREDRDQQMTARLAAMEMPPPEGVQWQQLPPANEGETEEAPPEADAPGGDVASASAEGASGGQREDLPPAYEPEPAAGASSNADEQAPWPALYPPDAQQQHAPATDAEGAGTTGAGAEPSDPNAAAAAPAEQAEAQPQQ